MSTFRNPVGPQPPQVYWRRRLLLGLGVLAVVVVVILIIVRPGSGTPSEPKASSSSSPAPSEKADASAACLPANLVLTAVTDKDSYAPGEQPQIGLSLSNTGSQSCSINMGSTVQELIILSGSEKYWSSKDCQSAPVDAEIVIEAGETKSTPLIPWDRTRSSTATCDAQRPAVPAGGASYHLSVKLGELSSEKTKQFLLNG
ncbi:hypothetical protein BH09ACT3_BH09ACT3_04980 [soil metagenome]